MQGSAMQMIQVDMRVDETVVSCLPAEKGNENIDWPNDIKKASLVCHVNEQDRVSLVLP